MRVDALDVVEPLAGQRREAQPHGDDDLADDGEVVLDEQVVVLADRAVDDVLDRHDARARRHPPATASKTARKLPTAMRSRSPERREHRVLGERAGLAGVGDLRHRAPLGAGAPRIFEVKSVRSRAGEVRSGGEVQQEFTPLPPKVLAASDHRGMRAIGKFWHFTVQAVVTLM